MVDLEITFPFEHANAARLALATLILSRKVNGSGSLDSFTLSRPEAAIDLNIHKMAGTPVFTS